MKAEMWRDPVEGQVAGHTYEQSTMISIHENTIMEAIMLYLLVNIGGGTVDPLAVKSAQWSDMGPDSGS